MIRLPYLVFLVCLILETCPIPEWNWDLGWWWLLIIFLTVVEIAVSVTEANAERKDRQ